MADNLTVELCAKFSRFGFDRHVTTFFSSPLRPPNHSIFTENIFEVLSYFEADRAKIIDYLVLN